MEYYVTIVTSVNRLCLQCSKPLSAGSSILIAVDQHEIPEKGTGYPFCNHDCYRKKQGRFEQDDIYGQEQYCIVHPD